jgi:hypothetical protein
LSEFSGLKILLNGAWLNERYFFYDGLAYDLSAMQRANVKKRLFKPRVLAIKFKDGRLLEFLVEPGSGTSTEHWALAINFLISRLKSAANYQKPVQRLIRA